MEITIKELADALGVSKPTISKAIDALGIQTELRKVGNRFVLSESQATAVKSQILQNCETETPPKLQEETESELQKPQSETEKSLISLLETQITILQEQLSVKDAQLSEKDKQIASLTISLQSSTAALAKAQESLQASQALQAGYLSQQLSERSGSSGEQSEGDVISDTPSHPESERKRGFFSRLFDKKR